MSKDVLAKEDHNVGHFPDEMTVGTKQAMLKVAFSSLCNPAKKVPSFIGRCDSAHLAPADHFGACVLLNFVLLWTHKMTQ